MRILVCGGRHFDDYALVRKTLSSLFPPSTDNMMTWLPPPGTVIIHGDAPGADSLADQWAVVNWVPVERYPADWTDLSHPDAVIRTRRDGTIYDAKAGARRNQRMIDEGKPDLAIAFPGGSGTADMKRRARRAGIKVMEVAADGSIRHL